MTTTTNQNSISRHNFLRKLALGVSFLPAAGAWAESEQKAEAKPNAGSLRAFVELARSDVRTQKAYIVAQNLPLTSDEAVEFWPLHREYEAELATLLDERYEAILQFAKDYGTMTDEQATGLAKKSFDLEAKRTGLKRTYFKKFAEVIPAVKTARFFQIENQLNMVVDLQVAASLPLIQ